MTESTSCWSIKQSDGIDLLKHSLRTRRGHSSRPAHRKNKEGCHEEGDGWRRYCPSSWTGPHPTDENHKVIAHYISHSSELWEGRVHEGQVQLYCTVNLHVMEFIIGKIPNGPLVVTYLWIPVKRRVGIVRHTDRIWPATTIQISMVLGTH